jgi:hypothetical protein
MKMKFTFLFLIISTISIYGQDSLKKITREKLVGEKIKFLLDNDNSRGYANFGKNENAYPYLDYQEFKERIATIISKNKGVYELKMDDNEEKVFMKIYDFSNIPNNIGLITLLESAKAKYIGKTLFNKELEKCEITEITFAEDDGKYSQLFGPFNVHYKVNNEIKMINIHFTESYGPVKGYTYDHQKERVFENIFTSKNPYTELTKDNISEKFSSDVDKMDDKTIYIHKQLLNEEYLKYDLGNFLDNKRKAILTKVVVSNGIPKIYFYSNYFSSDWLFHKKMKIKIGDVSKETTTVKGLTEVLDGGNVLERNTYNSSNDLAILKWIAENSSEEIMVRLYGKDYYDDFTIPMNEKMAIKETYDLYKLMKK